jgi:DNA modification methylase
MRQLPSESIDLIYIDPPFFSGRQYNIIFGDQNEVRSFTDIWEGGMPGYLIWLNARLYEMKRLLKKTGSIYVHCDWHASHYIKVEMDKIFGYENFLNEVVWCYGLGGSSNRYWPRKHDVILWYSKVKDGHFFEPDLVPATSMRMAGQLKKAPDYWDIPTINNMAKERIGYPTQKPEALLERIIKSSCPPGGVVGDFFCGGGTTPAVAQRLGRQWIACDQSRVAVAVTADRLIRGAQQLQMDLAIPDFTVEYWGVYEARRLTQMPEGEFRPFILRCFGATPNTDPNEPHIHGYKGSVPVWVCPPDARYEVSHTDVVAFANAVRRSIRYQQSDLRDGVMLGWAFTPEAREAADSCVSARASM